MISGRPGNIHAISRLFCRKASRATKTRISRTGYRSTLSIKVLDGRHRLEGFGKNSVLLHGPHSNLDTSATSVLLRDNADIHLHKASQPFKVL